MNSYTKGISGGDVCLIELVKRMNTYRIFVITSALGEKLCEENGLKADYLLTTNETRFGNIVGTYIMRIINSFFLPLETSDTDILYSGSDFLTDVIPAFARKKANKKAKWVQKIFHIIPSRRIISHYAQKLSFFLIRHSADVIIVDNLLLKNELIRRNFNADKIHVNYPGIDVDYYFNSESAAFGSEAVFLGRFHYSKGLFDLVEIWRRVCQKIPRAKLSIIGGGNKQLKNILEKRIMEAGLDGNITFTGYLEKQKMVETMKSAKVFVFPSHEEGFGIAIAEAMACGLPVIAWDLPVYREVFGDHITQIRENSIDLFSEKIIELLGNDHQRFEISRRGSEYIKRYSWHSVARGEREIIGD